MTAQDQERSRRERLREHGQIMFGLARGDIRYETVLGAMPALIACLFTGIAIGHPELGMIAAGGALSVGFGAFQNFTIHRAAPMVFALLGMLVATFLGSLAGGNLVLLVLCSAASSPPSVPPQTSPVLEPGGSPCNGPSRSMSPEPSLPI